MSNLEYKCHDQFNKIKKYIEEQEKLNLHMDKSIIAYHAMVKYKFWTVNINNCSEIENWQKQFPLIHSSVYNNTPETGFPYDDYTISKSDYEHLITLAKRYALSNPKMGSIYNKWVDIEFKKITKFSLADEKEYDQLIKYYSAFTKFTENELHVLCDNLYGTLMINRLKSSNMWNIPKN
jgi:hypothetical protein